MKVTGINYNNIYMFKNPIRHFLEFQQLEYQELDVQKMSWTKPVDFIIRRHYDNDGIRILKLPNALNYFNLYKKIEQTPNFFIIDRISILSRMSVNLETGDFSVFSYKKDMERDLLKLVEYDVLLKLDIKSFYDSIYTHLLQRESNLNFPDRYITNCNEGSTKGILMGSYVSLFLAEKLLKSIAERFSKILNDLSVEHSIKFFSDDFYIFTNKKNIDVVRNNFAIVLSEYGLLDSIDKTEIYDYLSYNNENIIDKYWNTILSIQRKHESQVSDKSRMLIALNKIPSPLKYRMNFLNQLIYRKNKLSSKKSQSILINGFFKSNFFINLDVSKYEINDSDLHNILYIMKEHPETCLYIVPKFKNFAYFTRVATIYLKKYFKKALNQPYQEEQMYYYYSLLEINKKTPFSSDYLEDVKKTNNQILISYYIISGVYDSTIDSLLNAEEKYWFQNYHVILRKFTNGLANIDDLIKTYLIPDQCKESQKANYHDFYKQNITNKKVLIELNISKRVKLYQKAKIEEKKYYSMIYR